MSVNWITESVVQFTRSPIWKGPVNNFIDENCYIFDSDEEMKLEYTKVHNEFRALVDKLLTDFVNEIGVPLPEVVENIRASAFTSQSGAERQAANRLLKYIYYCDDFVCFHRMMVKRNIELDILATDAIEGRASVGNTAQRDALAVGVNGDIDEEEALRQAIAASLGETGNYEERMRLEDAELQQALALSLQAEEERANMAKQLVEKNVQQVIATNPQGAQEYKTQQMQAIVTQKEQNKATLAGKTLEARKENVKKNIEASMGTVAVTGDRPRNSSLVGRIDAPRPPGSATQHEPAQAPEQAPAAPPQQRPQICPAKPPAAGPGAPEVNLSKVPETAPTATVSPPAPAPSAKKEAPAPAAAAPAALPPVGHKKPQGFSALPPIAGQPPLEELQRQYVPDPAPKPAPTAATAQRADPTAAAPSKAPTKEELQERAKYMKEQRAKILALNKANRQKAIDDYAKTNNVPVQSDAEKAEKQLTVDIARRLRADLVQETRKQ